MDKVLDWWHSHEPRDQIIIAVVGCVFSLFLFIFVLILPVLDWHAQEKKLLKQTKADLADVKVLAAQIKERKNNSRNAQSKQSLAVLIDNSVRENSLLMRDFNPGNKKDARLRLENAAYPALSQWLYDLEYRHNIRVEDLSLTPSNLQGRLMVNLRVSQ